jgi:hypothetical protein
MPIFSPELIQQYVQEAGLVPTNQIAQSTSLPTTPITNNIPPQPKGLPWGYKAGIVGGNVLDGISTELALRSNPDSHEANPLLGSHPNPYAILGIKAGIATGLSYVLDKLSKADHPTLAKGLALVAAAISGGAGLSNLKYIR